MKRTLSIAAASALLLGAFALPAHAADPVQVPRLVKDIDPGSKPSFSTWHEGEGNRSAVIGSTMLFGAANEAEGSELWATDGTTAGTHLVKDIYPGMPESSPQNLTTYAGKVYFSAESEDGKGREVWASDGTTSGTVRVSDLNADPSFMTGDSDPRDFVVAGGSLYFSGQTSENTRSLYRLTAGGTPQKLTGFAVKYVSNVAAWGSKVAFTGTTTTGGIEPWVTDGTFNGTHQLKDINPGTADSTPLEYTALGNGGVLFSADDGTHGTEIWTSNGTVTQQLKDLNLGAASGLPTDLYATGGKAYFAAKATGNPYTIWVTDGTGAGTKQIASIRGGSNSGTLSDFTVYKGIVYFGASEQQHGSELWRTDGTTGGTYMVRDTNPGIANGSPHDMAVVDGLLYFVFEDDDDLWRLWRTDGTTDGTFAVPTDVDPSGVELLSTVGNTLFFAGKSPAEGRELWAYTTRVNPPASAPAPAVSKRATSTKAHARSSYSKAVAKNKKIRIKITVRANGATPTGTVVLKKGSRIVGRGTLAKGAATVRITKKLTKGTTKLRAYYSGSTAAKPSRSGVVKVRVR